MIKKGGFFMVLLIGLIACSDRDADECAARPDITNPVAVKIEPLHNMLLDMRSKDALKGFIQTHPVIAHHFLRSSSYPNDSVMIETLLKKFGNPYIDTLQQAINAVFGDLKTLERELSEAYSSLMHYYPEVRVPRVQTVATGFNFDLFISDSLIVIGLDYYLGSGARFRPNMYQYILQRYQPAYIVPSIMLLWGISPRFNATDIKDKTILADMISYGKAFHFAKRMMPCTPDSVLIWYDTEEIEGCKENVDIIWTHFVENELLFETNHMIKKKYIDDRPKTYEIGENAPGRIGAWLGWQIVNKYMEEYPQTTLSELMAIKEPRKLFGASKFKPDKKGFF